MKKRNFCNQLTLAIFTVAVAVSQANGAASIISCRSALLAGATENTDLVETNSVQAKIEQLSQSIDQLLAVTNRRVDVEVTELILQNLAPILENSGKVLKENTVLNAKNFNRNLGNKALGSVQSAEKTLNKLWKLNARSLSFHVKLMRLVPGLIQSRTARNEKIFSNQHRDLLTLQTDIQVENKDFVTIESSIKSEITQVEAAITALGTWRDTLQQKIWQSEEFTSEDGKQLRANLIQTLSLVDRQVEGFAELKSVALALQWQINNVLDRNKFALESIATLINRRIGVVQSFSTVELKLGPALAMQAKDPVPKSQAISTVTVEEIPALDSSQTEDMHDVARVVKTAREFNTYDLRDKFIWDYYISKIKSLTAPQLIRLAQGVHYNDNRDRILLDYTNARVNEISSKDAIHIAKSSYGYDTRDKVLLMFSNLMKSTTEEIKYVAQTCHYNLNRDSILRDFVLNRGEILNSAEVIALAKLSNGYDIRDNILLHYTRKFRSKLSNDEIGNLANTAHYNSNRDALRSLSNF